MTYDETAVFLERYIDAAMGARFGEPLAQFYTEDAIVIERPYVVASEMVAAEIELAFRHRGEFFDAQNCSIDSLIVDGNRAALTLLWTGTLKAAAARAMPGDRVKRRDAHFFVLRDGRIARQETYTCFE